MKSRASPASRRRRRAADAIASRRKKVRPKSPAAFHPTLANGLARDGDSRQSYRESWTIRNTGRTAPWRETSMRAAIGSSALARIFLVAGFGVALLAAPASAQKQGGSITVGLELDIPGFDPLKVGVFDTAALTAAAAIFDTLTVLDDKGVAAAEACAVLDPFGRLQDLDLQAAAGRQIPRWHAVQRGSSQGEFRPAEGSRQQMPLRLLHRLRSTACRRPTN